MAVANILSERRKSRVIEECSEDGGISVKSKSCTTDQIELEISGYVSGYASGYEYFRPFACVL